MTSVSTFGDLLIIENKQLIVLCWYKSGIIVYSVALKVVQHESCILS